MAGKPIRVGTVSTVRMDTGEVLSAKEGAFQLLPPTPGLCQECAVAHPPEQPHHAQSLYYQIAFQARHGRPPNWADAMAHCDAATRAFWREQLRANMAAHGLEIPEYLKD
jgi:hypothetical protein